MYQTRTQNKRKVFFEHLHPTTTGDSLKAYLSKEYQMEICNIPLEEGTNNGYGTVIFSTEEYVHQLMANRPHRIDGQEVEIYRAVPSQRSLREDKGKRNLIVSEIKDKLSKSDLNEYFKKYGTIDNIVMNDEANSCRIEFQDYDSVDKALLDAPHIIWQVHVKLEKGDRDYPSTTKASSSDMQPVNVNSIGVIPKHLYPKQVNFSYQLSPNKVYHIHITNLPLIMNADMLSEKFNWPIYNILMHPSSDEQSLAECWLKDLNNQQTADEFIAQWDRKINSELRIKYEIEEDTTELCKFFRIGQCKESDAACPWKHIMCAEPIICSSSGCLYGHAKGIKRKIIDNESTETYRIKISGFRTKLTPQLLAQLLEYNYEKRCYVNPSQNQIGYIVNLKTTKFAKHLIESWHGKEIEGGHKLICQLEQNIFPFTSKACFKPVSERTGSHSRSESCERSNSTEGSSRDSSLSRNHNDSTVKQQEWNTKRKESTASSVRSPSELTLSQLSSDESVDQEWEEGKKSNGSNGQVLLIRGKINRKVLAVKKIYNNFESYKNELKALTILKDINNVSQLIEYSSDKNKFWIRMERASGHSLKEFINPRHHNGLGVLEIIQLVQKLLIIIKQVHSQGIFYRNLKPEHIMIEWDSKNTSIKDAHLTLIDFSQAYIKSDGVDCVSQQSKEKWYQPLQAHVAAFEYSSTMDATDICAILFWLLTNIDPQHGYDTLPHQCPIVEDKINTKVTEAIRTANLAVKETQLKLYLIDTFNSAFGYPEYQPWTIDNLELRLESIRELLLPTYPDLVTTELIFQNLLSISDNSTPTTSVEATVHQNIFEKASNAFYQAKKLSSQTSQNQYLWSEGNCIWLDNAQVTINERRNDDILTYYSRHRNTSSSCSIIITCLATVSDGGNIITLSICSSVNGKIIRIPIGRYGKNQDYLKEFENDFQRELKNLVISFYKERKPVQ